MTREICSHHFWFAIYGIINIVLIYLIVSCGITYAYHDWKDPPISLAHEQFVKWDGAVAGFEIGLALIILLNIAGFYFMNERYEWFTLKDCGRIK